MAQGMHLFAGITPDDIIYGCLPLYHTNGGILAAGQMLFWGSTLVLRKKFSASNFFIDCVKHKCTVSKKFSSLTKPTENINSPLRFSVEPPNNGEFGECFVHF